jgi:hypothetical protein
VKPGTLLYLGMLLLLGSGFEVIRRFGTTLTAPRDIAGVWRLTLPSSSDPCPILEVRSPGEGEMQVEQSGRYLRLIFPDEHHTKFRAYFRDGAFQGSGLSSHRCARGTPVSLSGRLTESHLDVVLTRAAQPLGTPAASLTLSASRAPDRALHSPTSPQVPAHGQRKE